MLADQLVRNCVVSLGFVLLLAFARPGASQSDNVETDQSEADKTLPEVIVYGDKSMVVLRNELYRAEEEFFSVFNSLNSTDDFDIRCKKETFLGERRKHHLCRPRFALRFESQAGSNMSFSNKSLPVGLEPWDYSDLDGKIYSTRLNRKQRELSSEMEVLVSQHPELQKELANVKRANAALTAKRDERKKD